VLAARLARAHGRQLPLERGAVVARGGRQRGGGRGAEGGAAPEQQLVEHAGAERGLVTRVGQVGGSGAVKGVLREGKGGGRRRQRRQRRERGAAPRARRRGGGTDWARRQR